MMSSGNLIMIENGHLEEISLEGKNVWEVGRPTEDSHPDICMHTRTVSRRHGKFKNIGGCWVYVDYNTKNGTVRNNKRIRPNKSSKASPVPVMLGEGDTFIFGSGDDGLICPKTVWATFTMKHFPGGWRVIDTKNMHRLVFVDGEKAIKQEQLVRGTVLSGTYGMAIYMGDITYLTGNVSVEDADA